MSDSRALYGRSRNERSRDDELQDSPVQIQETEEVTQRKLLRDFQLWRVSGAADADPLPPRAGSFAGACAYD